MQLAPQVENDRTAMESGSLQPIADRIFVDLQDATGRPQGISFGKGAHRRLENRWVALQAIVGGGVAQGHTAPATFAKRFRLTITATVFDHFALLKGRTIVSTSFVRAIKRFPIHFRILRLHLECFRGYANRSLLDYLITGNEGQHPKIEKCSSWFFNVRSRSPHKRSCLA